MNARERPLSRFQRGHVAGGAGAPRRLAPGGHTRFLSSGRAHLPIGTARIELAAFVGDEEPSIELNGWLKLLTTFMAGIADLAIGAESGAMRREADDAGKQPLRDRAIP